MGTVRKRNIHRKEQDTTQCGTDTYTWKRITASPNIGGTWEYGQ